ncbi:Tissue inhibitor of metalloproteinase [Pseudolycoriella hygida]|uniref:Tissue inhibitor of metalloproteinase n=1 Tax=Pseudolycoriella hygida TaxID=35572 RepID=A0A9Q0MYE2_9DIPT|nr:Tissue inhibitor of metalloproteinase [Pseudolycoriella hygida]
MVMSKEMAKTSSYLTVLCILFIAYLAGITDACMCQAEHPQTKYCKADYVIIARVLRKSVRRENNHDVYKILVKKSYKMSKTANHSLKDGRIITASSDSMCGIPLKQLRKRIFENDDCRKTWIRWWL